MHAWAGSRRSRDLSSAVAALALEKCLDEIVRIELAQILDTLTNPDEPHGNLQLIGDSQDDATLSGSIQLREDDTRNGHRLREDLCLGYRILTAGRVDHEPGLVRRPRRGLADHAPHLL